MSNEPFAVSSEHHELVKASAAGLCTPMLREQVGRWLEQLDGEQIFVYVRQIGVTLTIAELRTLVDRADPK